MVVDRRAADAAVAHPAAVRVDLGEVLRQRDSPAVRADSGAALRRQRGRAGGAVRRPRRARLPAGAAPSSSGSARPNEEYLRRNRRLIALQGFFFPSMSFFLGLGALLVLWLGSREVIARPHHARRVRRVQRLPDDAELADDRVRLGDEHAAARHGVVEADARGARHASRRSRDRRTAGRSASSQRAAIRSAATSSSAISTFAYGGTTGARPRVGARLPAGQTVALVGATGSGKSTLISLLARLHDPPPGTVFVDGVDVRDIPLADAARRDRLRAAGAVSVLGHARRQHRVRAGRDRSASAPRRTASAQLSAAEQRACGEARRIARIVDAAASRGSTRTSPTFPKGYDTMVGERGITLSGGQKQRTAIARAVVIDPRILILDDALSAVDTYTEEEILSRLRGRHAAADVDHRLAPRLDGARRRSDPRARRGAHRRARHARRSWFGATGCTRSCTGSSCSKRSWRRREAVQQHDDEILGKAYDARLMRRLLALSAPVLARRWRVAFVAIIVGAARGAGAAVPDEARHRPLHRRRGDLEGLGRLAVAVPRGARAGVRRRVRPDLDDAADRAADHVRPADGDLRPPAAARPRVTTTAIRSAG